MPTTTPKLGITEMSSSQSQPEVTVNSAIRALETYAQLSVLDSTLTEPPTGSPAPVDGDVYIVAASPTGDWAGHHNDIAYLVGGTWKFLTPQEGWIAYDQNNFGSPPSPGYLKFISAAWTAASI
jgi:Protein of unknown function (DUF2793)